MVLNLTATGSIGKKEVWGSSGPEVMNFDLTNGYVESELLLRTGTQGVRNQTKNSHESCLHAFQLFHSRGGIKCTLNA